MSHQSKCHPVAHNARSELELATKKGVRFENAEVSEKIPPVTVSCASQTIPVLCDRAEEVREGANLVLEAPIRSPCATSRLRLVRAPPMLMATTHGELDEDEEEDVADEGVSWAAVQVTPASSNIAIARGNKATISVQNVSANTARSEKSSDCVRECCNAQQC